MKFDVLLLVTDATTYKKRRAEGLSMNYPKMIHTKCVAHALHRVCETICMFYPNVNKLGDNRKKTFVISPVRIQVFKSRAPDIPFLTNSRNYTLGNLVACHFVLCRKIFCSVVHISTISYSSI